MKMYRDYINEREGQELIRSEKGFITYKEENGHLLICDLYIKPKYRKHNEASRLIKEVEALSKKDYIIATIDENANGWEIAQFVALKNEFVLHKKHGTVRYFIKEIKRG